MPQSVTVLPSAVGFALVGSVAFSTRYFILGKQCRRKPQVDLIRAQRSTATTLPGLLVLWIAFVAHS
jgi:hypothetical protein